MSIRRILSRALVLMGFLSPLLVPLGVPPASAAVGDPSYAGCLSGTVIAGCTTAGPGLFAVDVELSPDGRQLYVLGREPSLRIYDIGAFGALVPRSGPGSCFNAGGTDGCTEVPGFDDFDVYDVTISGDGTSLYAGAYDNLVSWTRSPASGALTPSACYGPGAGCTALARTAPVWAVVVSPDNKNVYVRQGDGLLVYDRNETTGLLTAKPGAAGCWTEAAIAGCTDSFGLTGNGFEIAMSSDGSYLYLTLQNPGGVSVFNRAGDGTLSRYGGTDGACISVDGSSSVPGECSAIAGGSAQAIGNAWAATLSPSGKHLFVSGNFGTTVFARASDTGKLTRTDCVSPIVTTDCQQVSASTGMGVRVAPDGRRAFVGSNDVAGVGVFDFNETTGTLSRLAGASGCFSATASTGCTDLPGASGGNGKAAVSADGLSVYFVATGPVHRLKLDAAPVCQPVSATGKAGVAMTVQLSCTDPNGDPLSQIGFAPAPPAHSELFGLDLAAQTQVLVAEKSFVGTISFTYTATANGVTSAPASGTITVTDGAAAIVVRGSKVPLRKDGKATVRLKCPATEKNGPCTGTLKVKTRGKVATANGKKVVTLASTKYRIKAGVTKGVVVTLSPANRALVRRSADARKLKLVTKVKDSIGNTGTVIKKATLKLP